MLSHDMMFQKVDIPVAENTTPVSVSQLMVETNLKPSLRNLKSSLTINVDYG